MSLAIASSGALPLSVLSLLRARGLHPTRLALDTPALGGLLRALCGGTQPVLDASLAQKAIVDALLDARVLLAVQREVLFRAVLPRAVVATITRSGVALRSVRRVVAAWRSREELDWAVGNFGCGADAWAEVGNSRLIIDDKDNGDEYVAGANVDAEEAWATVSERLAVHCATLLAELSELWNVSLGSTVDTLGVAAPEELAAAILAAAVFVRKCGHREDAAAMSLTLCEVEATAGCVDALRIASSGAACDAGRAQIVGDNGEAAAATARARATAGKVRVMRAQTVRDSYCMEGAVDALEEAGNVIETRKRAVNREMREKQSRLREYEALGSSFREVADEYGRKCNERQRKMWSRNQLRPAADVIPAMATPVSISGSSAPSALLVASGAEALQSRDAEMSSRSRSISSISGNKAKSSSNANLYQNWRPE
jgi:HAUS augmin-like complex subunit 4